MLLSLPTPVAPALKGESLPKELIDLLPEDTAGVVVVDVRKLAESDLGKQLIRGVAEHMGEKTPFQPFSGLLMHAQRIVIAQFGIDQDGGDVCLLVELAGNKSAADAFVKDAVAKDSEPRNIGRHTVYDLDSGLGVFARPNKWTIMLVRSFGSDEQLKVAELAAFGERKSAGPHGELRSLLEADRPASQAIYFAGTHPSKASHAAGHVLQFVGIDREKVRPIGDGLKSYAGGVTFGDSAVASARFRTKDAAAAKLLLKCCQDSLAAGIHVDWRLNGKMTFDMSTDDSEFTVEIRVDPEPSRQSKK